MSQVSVVHLEQLKSGSVSWSAALTNWSLSAHECLSLFPIRCWIKCLHGTLVSELCVCKIKTGCRSSDRLPERATRRPDTSADHLWASYLSGGERTLSVWAGSSTTPGFSCGSDMCKTSPASSKHLINKTGNSRTIYDFYFHPFSKSTSTEQHKTANTYIRRLLKYTACVHL